MFIGKEGYAALEQWKPEDAMDTNKSEKFLK